MLAVSRERDRLFVYHPEAGMAVPVVVDLAAASWTVAFPSATELEQDFFACRDWADVLHEIKHEDRVSAEAGRRSSTHYTALFREQINGGGLTVTSLRRMVQDDRAVAPADVAETTRPVEAPTARGFFTAD